MANKTAQGSTRPTCICLLPCTRWCTLPPSQAALVLPMVFLLACGQSKSAKLLIFLLIAPVLATCSSSCFLGCCVSLQDRIAEHADATGFLQAVALQALTLQFTKSTCLNKMNPLQGANAGHTSWIRKDAQQGFDLLSCVDSVLQPIAYNQASTLMIYFVTLCVIHFCKLVRALGCALGLLFSIPPYPEQPINM